MEEQSPKSQGTVVIYKLKQL